MVTRKTEKEIENLREGGKRLAVILKTLAAKVAPGVTSFELEDLAMQLVREGGDKASFYMYKPHGAKRPYPAALCLSINNDIVHGIPNEEKKILQEGDIVSLDMGIIHKGMFTDSAVTVSVGKIDENAQKLLEVTEKALYLGIKAAKGGGTVGDIGFAIEQYVKNFGFGIVKELSGHGVGYKVHEDPYIPNFGKKGEGEKLLPGMVIAIEPIINEGSPAIKLGADGYTYKTRDGKRSAHFEHTVLITEGDAEILT